MRDAVETETDKTETTTDAAMDSATAARIRQYAYVESGRRGGSKKGPTKARQGTGANVARYWDRVYAGEIQHPGYDPKNPKRKTNSKRYNADGSRRDPSDSKPDRKARTVIPRPGIGGVSADIVLEDEFAASLGRMGF